VDTYKIQANGFDSTIVSGMFGRYLNIKILAITDNATGLGANSGRFAGYTYRKYYSEFGNTLNWQAGTVGSKAYIHHGVDVPVAQQRPIMSFMFEYLRYDGSVPDPTFNTGIQYWS